MIEGPKAPIQRVTYVLGAGFAAPLGLPVMASFPANADDLHFEDQERHAGVDEVSRRIHQCWAAEKCFETDLSPWRGVSQSPRWSSWGRRMRRSSLSSRAACGAEGAGAHA